MPNRDIEKLRELIHPQAVLTPSVDSLGFCLYELREMKEDNSVIWIKGVPEESVVFNLDSFFPEPNQIFAGSKSECCRSDFVIVTNANNGKNMVFIELKSGDDKDYAHMKNQLRGAQAFMGYCSSVLDSFWNYNLPLNQYMKHYVVCTRTSMKYSQKFDNNEHAHTDVENPLKLEGSNQYLFNRLIGRKPR